MTCRLKLKRGQSNFKAFKSFNNDFVIVLMQMRVMNYNFHTIKDDWRMKVWNKSLKLPTSWSTLKCETFGEIRRVTQYFEYFDIARKIIRMELWAYYRCKDFSTITSIH